MILYQKEILQKGSGIAGGKAFALAESQASGAPVPDFFVITADSATNDAKLKKQSHQEIEAAVSRLMQGENALFAVRSSARSEDGAEVSHAGQFLSKLNQRPEDIIDAVEAVFASGLAVHVEKYRQARGLTGVELPSVVVQRQVDAQSAGVAFSADPVSGRTDRVVISAIAGLGEQLVSGEVDGEDWQVGKVKKDIFSWPPNAVILTEKQAKDVAALCINAEKLKKIPQDIEWAIDQNKKIWHLQNRPITSFIQEGGRSETILTVLDNSNIVESYPGLVSPLTFSFATMAYDRVYRAFLKMVGTPVERINQARGMLANMLVLCDGRMYYNLGNWYRLLTFLPFFSKNRSNMETMMGVSSPIPDEAVADVEPPSFLALMRMISFLLGKSLFFPLIRRKFYQRMKDAMPEGAASDDLNRMTLSELGREYRRLEAALLDRWDAPILNDILCMMSYGGSRKYLERHAGKAGILLHNDVMIGQGGIISAEPAKLILEAGRILAQSTSELKEAIAAGNIDFTFADAKLGPKLREYIVQFGDRRIGELKLESPTLQDDPSPLLAAVSAAAAMPDKQNTESATPTESLKTLFSGHPIRRLLASFMLSYAKERVKDRENLRFERTRIFARARRIFLRIGQELTATGRLKNYNDIFFLELNDVLGSVEGFAVTHDLAALVEVRKVEQDKNLALPEPNERILVRGAVGDRAARIDNKPIKSSFNKGDDKERRGLACGTGKVKARVRIIRDPLTTQLKHGEVLVARNTDPGWISHFVNAAAVVVERGSILSHSAIVSRELGIPCVVAVKGVCDWLKDGDLIEVDGGEGIVRKCDD